MHRLITILFSSILSTVHLVFFLGLGLVLVYGGTSIPDNELSQLELIFVIIGSVILYVLFAGISSVLIRINENLEDISKYLNNMADDPD